jgi:hypothetical protein
MPHPSAEPIVRPNFALFSPPNVKCRSSLYACVPQLRDDDGVLVEGFLQLEPDALPADGAAVEERLQRDVRRCLQL